MTKDSPTRTRIVLVAACCTFLVLSVGGVTQPMFGDEIPIVRNILRFGQDRTLVPAQFNYPTFFSYFLAVALVPILGIDWLVEGRHPIDFVFGLVWSFKGSAAFGVELALLRGVTLILGVGVVVAAFALGRAAFGQREGLMAAIVVAASNTLVFRAGLAVPDVLVALLTTMALAICVSRVRAAAAAGTNVRLRTLLPAAGFVGLGIATKYNASLTLLGVLCAWTVAVTGQPSRPGAAARRLVGGWLALGGGAAALFLLACPAVFVKASSYWAGFRFESRHMMEGQLYIDLGDHPWLWIPRRLWEQEGTVGAFLMVGLIALSFLRRDRVAWILGVPVLAAFAIVGSWRYTSLHYLLWTFPILAVLGTGLIGGLNRPRRAVWPIWVAIAAVVLPSALPAAARSFRWLRKENNAAAAERWIETNVAAGERVDQDWYGMPTLWNADTHQEFLKLVETYPKQLNPRWLRLVNGKPVYTGYLGFQITPPSATMLQEDPPKWVVTNSDLEPPSLQPLPGYGSARLTQLHRRLAEYYHVLHSSDRYQVVHEFRDGPGPIIRVYSRR